MNIGKQPIGGTNPCFIIAEAGSNHNRELNLAKELISAAAEAKAGAIKFQLFKGEKHYSKFAPLFSSYAKHPQDLLKEIELPLEWLSELNEYAKKKNIIFFSSVTDPLDVDALEKINVPAYKLASFELVDLGLIEYTAKKNKPIILSTGLANFEEIDDAYSVCKKAGNNDIIFLQCASVYPAKPQIMNLKAMNTIQAVFPDTIVGLSDHTLGVHISVAAVAMGAKVIEKHFTLDSKMPGPDHAVSINPSELAEMVQKIRDVEAALGDGKKSKPSNDELEYYFKARRSIHARSNIKKGESITPDKLVVKRPGYGIKPKYMDILSNRSAKRDINADEWIKWDMI
jgi:sialic acid synthase SpsE